MARIVCISQKQVALKNKCGARERKKRRPLNLNLKPVQGKP